MTDQQNLEYAIRLATFIWEKHYKNISPNWKPFDNMSGVLSQLDNMFAGLSEKTEEYKQSAEYWEHKFYETTW